MRKDFGQKTWFYPMPVLLIGTYDENGKADVMNAAWGGVYDTNLVMVCLSPEHRTTANMRARKAFTISFADVRHVTQADYVGLVSANDEPCKLELSGFQAVPSSKVDAPLLADLPMTLECSLVKINEDGVAIGRIENISVDEAVLGTDGKIDPEKLSPISYDAVHNEYRVLGPVVGKAFRDGLALKR